MLGGGNDKETETTTTHGLSDEVVENYETYYGDRGMSPDHVNNILNTLNPTSQDTVFINQSPSLNMARTMSDMDHDSMIHEFLTDGQGGKSTITSDTRNLFGIPTKVEEEGETYMYPQFPTHTTANQDNSMYTESKMSSKIPLQSNWELMQQEKHGGIVDYLKKERSINRNNNRILAEQRISDFQRFMKNRK